MTNDIKNSPAADRKAAEQARKRIELGKSMIKEGEIPFEIDLDNEDVVEVRAKNLASSKDANEAELSFLLYTLREKRGYLDKNYQSFNEYVEREVGISRSKASGLATTWEMFLSLGLPITVLGGKNRISWNKFRLLKPAVKAGVINGDSIYEWLPYVAAAGPESLLDKDIETRVRRLVGEPDTDTPEFTTIKLRVPTDQVEALYGYQDTIALGLKIEDRGMQYVRSMEYLFSSIVDNSLESAKVAGLCSLKRAAEAIAPGVSCVFFAPDTKEFTQDTLGIVPVHYIYQGFSGSNSNKEIVHVLATSDEEAKRILGTDVVRKFPVVLAESVKNPAQAAPPAPPATEVNIDQPVKSVATETVFQYNRPIDFDLIDSESRNKIIQECAQKLIDKKIITGPGFNERIEELKPQCKTKKDLQVLAIHWLYGMCEEHKIVVFPIK